MMFQKWDREGGVEDYIPISSGGFGDGAIVAHLVVSLCGLGAKLLQLEVVNG